MTVTISANGLSISHAGSNGISTATIPDVCKTPTPAGPVPMPYPNISMSSSLSDGTKTVVADGGNMIAIKESKYATSSGDEPGTAGGVTSSTFKKESPWITYSFDVKFDGSNVCRLPDKKFQNQKNTVDLGGNVQAPVVGADQPADDKKPCDASVTIGRIIRGNPYVPRDAPDAGMPDSVPPGKSYEVEVKVDPSLDSCPGQFIQLSIINGGPENGTAAVSPGRITATTNVRVTGGRQTLPGHAAQLKIQAKLDGKTVKAESAGFMVCAHPVNFSDTYAGDVDEPRRVGVRVRDAWESDSGSVTNLDKAEISEVVEYDAPTSPPYAGMGAVNNSGYLGADQFSIDTHTIGRPAAGPAASWERRQVSIFKCHRCGTTDKVQPNSGLKITHYVFDDAGQWKHHVKKVGAAVSAGGYSSGAATANVTSPDHLLP